MNKSQLHEALQCLAHVHEALGALPDGITRTVAVASAVRLDELVKASHATYGHRRRPAAEPPATES